MPNDLYEATVNAIKNGVKAPRKQFGMMCHHMILDLLERAGLITSAEGITATGSANSEPMARNLWAQADDPILQGDNIKKTIKEKKGMIIALCTAYPGQNPAHSLVTLGDGKVAGYNNLGSTNNEVGLDFQWFYWSKVKLGGVTIRCVDPSVAVERIKALP